MSTKHGSVKSMCIPGLFQRNNWRVARKTTLLYYARYRKGRISDTPTKADGYTAHEARRPNLILHHGLRFCKSDGLHVRRGCGGRNRIMEDREKLVEAIKKELETAAERLTEKELAFVYFFVRNNEKEVI